MNSDSTPGPGDSTPSAEDASEPAQWKKTEAIEILFDKLCPSGPSGEDEIQAILPIVLKVVEHKGERGIYVVQFAMIGRDTYAKEFADPTRLYEMPLVVQSRSFFAPRPHVEGISRRQPRAGKRRR